MKRKSKVLSLILLLVLALLTAIAAGTSVSRYVFREQDQITGSFTDLYFSHDGQGRVVLMEPESSSENSDYVGYFTFTANNFEGDNVTPRNIEYTLRLPTQTELSNGYIMDAWGTEQSLINSEEDRVTVSNTQKYELAYYDDGVNSSTIAAIPDGENFLPNSHSDMFTLTRNADGERLEGETIYLIAEITYPYQELHLFTVNTSTNLLTVSATPVRDPETHFSYTQYWVNVQTARSFENAVEGVYTDSPVKVVLTWEADAPVIFDSGRFAAATEGNMVNKEPYGENENNLWGEYRWHAESTSENGRYTNTVTLYLPQGSDARLYFYVYGQNSFSLTAQAWFQTETGGTYGAEQYYNIAGADAKTGIVIQDGAAAGN